MSKIKNSITSQKRSDALPPPPREILTNVLQVKHITVEWLAGDGSDRCYYRLHSEELNDSLVLMQLSENDAIKLKEDGYDWLKIARLLKASGLRVPAPIANLNDHAALIIEDYGDVMLESVVLEAWEKKDYHAINRWYDACFDIIAQMLVIQRDSKSIWCQRAFDEEKYGWELRFFKREYLESSLELKLNAAQWEAFEKDVIRISSFLKNYSTYFVHRDFHSRNIMVKNNDLALIDFQDARLGALTYDLVSLVFDNYVPFTPAFREELLWRGCDYLATKHKGLSLERIKEELPAVILQRQLKAIGTYGFLTVNKKRGNYLPYVVPALASLTENLVADQRWPFLSIDLLEILRKTSG